MDCPVCSKQFSINVINAHVNKCLNLSCANSEPRSSRSKNESGVTATSDGGLETTQQLSKLAGGLESGNGRCGTIDDDVFGGNEKRKSKRLLSLEDEIDVSPIEDNIDNEFGDGCSNGSVNMKNQEQPKKKFKIETEVSSSTAKSWNFLLNPSKLHHDKSPNGGAKSKPSHNISKKQTVDSTKLNPSKSPPSSSSVCSMEDKNNYYSRKSHERDSKKTFDQHFNNPLSLKKTETICTEPEKPQKQGPVSLNAPLAEQMRPLTLEDYVGQDQAVGRDKLLRSLLDSHQIPSMIFWGPPGCGKTTLAKIIANKSKGKGLSRFAQLSATTAGISDVKEVIKIAKNELKLFKRRTILFVDEIHRFNKSQQDTFLPHVEDGTITLIGATTENPSFQVNNALLSRCRVIVLEKLSAESLMQILHRALPALRACVIDDVNDVPGTAEDDDTCIRPRIFIEENSLEMLANLCDGDARAALNGLQAAVQARIAAYDLSRSDDQYMSHTDQFVVISVDHIKDGLQRSHVQYDKTGEEHYNIISALHKSVRGSDASAALYWLARMLEGGENPLYVARRLVRMASEDIGLADPYALQQAVATYQACHFIGMPECEVILAQCTVYLARAAKSVEVYTAYKKAQMSIKQHQGALPSVPLHLRNASTKLMKDLGYAKGYKYNPDYSEPVEQEYLPDCLKGTDFFK